MITLTANLSAAARRDTLYGREYLVAPLTLIVPGVLNGSRGPLLYPQDEIAKTVEAWNGVPIIVYHPSSNGLAATARSSEILNAQGVGTILGSKANGKLTAEGWFDIERLRIVDNRVLNLLEAGEKIELSTGLSTDNEPALDGAVYEGKPYSFIARNFRPDHLAVLPDQTGACSINDGCGVFNNDVANALPASAYAYVPNSDNPSTWKLRIDDVAHIGAAIAALGKGFRGQKVQLPASAVKAVKAKVRAAWLKAHPDKTKKDLPSILVNTDNEENRMAFSNNEKKKMVDEIITNACYWDAEDRKELMELTDNQLTKIQDQVKKEQQHDAVATAAMKGFTDPSGNKHTWNKETQKWETKEKTKEEVTINTEGKDKKEDKEPQTTEEWMASAPPAVKSAVQNAMAIEEREKEELIGRLTENLEGDVKESLTKALQPKPIDELKTLAVLAPKPKVIDNYSGAAGADQTDNRAGLTPVGLPGEYL